MANRIRIILIATFLTISLFCSSATFATVDEHKRETEYHTANWDGFTVNTYVNFEREKRNERDKARKQAKLEYLRDVLNLAGEYYVKDETVAKEAEEAAKVDGAPTASTENEVAFETVRQSIIARTTLLENEIKAKDDAYTNALRGWENQYRIDRTNALHRDVLYVKRQFHLRIARPPYNPLSGRRRTERYTYSENFNDIDARWELVGNDIRFDRWSSDKNPKWTIVTQNDRSFCAEFSQDSPCADDSTTGHANARFHITLTLKYTEKAISDRVNEEIRLCKQNVK